MRKRYWFILDICIALAVALIGVWAGAGLVRSNKHAALLSQPPVRPVTVRAVAGNETLLDSAAQMAADQTVLDALQAAARDKNTAVSVKSYGDMGTLVTAIGGVENGRDGKYWQYWVNGAYASAAADKTVIRPGDTVEWKFSADQQ